MNAYICGYKFVTLDNLIDLKKMLLTFCQTHSIKGTILLSEEGINVMLAAGLEAIDAFELFIKNMPSFADIDFKRSHSVKQPFKRMFVKLKKEIITLRQPDIRPDKNPAPAIQPVEFKQWLDEHRDVVIIDTRNEYEHQMGSFVNAINLHIDEFTEFPQAIEQLPVEMKEKPVVVFCTGGIR
ncbi:MAG: hypothetical protein K2Q14_02260, partial [Gammaproteobacteria bacterium]|nr:hypothetical protein [Gammaproteobacteria bacterium]